MMCKNHVSLRSNLLFLVILTLCACQEKANDQATSAEVPDAWFRNRVIYNVDVDSYKDSNADGTGDFNGLIEKLGYLQALGIQTIWLSPFQPTPDKDDGYDVADYYGIDKRLGTPQDFQNFMHEAKKRKMKVIMDMVLNHTSINHPWYQQARSDSTSKFFNWYVWSKDKPADWNKGMAFPGVQTETWTYDEVAKRYYFHRFYDFQPDLNYENPEVQKESVKILKYWLAKGVDGFRLDAVPFILDKPKTGSTNSEHMMPLLTYIVSEIKKLKPDVLFLGEANVAPKENKDYFGEKGERLTMMFNFYANQFLFYSLADEDATSFAKALTETKAKPKSAQWAYFLRNHDEIDLGRLSAKQIKRVYQKFGPENNMQLYDRGIRRRLAPMLNNMKQLKMAYSLLFSLPGTPVIRSGEEIGMGDDLTLNERLSVRTPMQWSEAKNAGFSMAAETFRPVIRLGDFNYLKVNVEDELKDQNSVLTSIKKFIKMREACPEIGLGDWRIIDSKVKQVFILKYEYLGRSLLTIHNLDMKPQDLSIESTASSSYHGLTDGKNYTVSGGQLKIHLEGYGSLWLQHKQD
jgi:maltose alpha-D-glucosyltransferase/alpha-amylase